ncbi:rubredoxin-like domain-containing protein [Geobacter sp. AOG1]|nr:rubredoxin [Geobacter sp. AOG1]GFE58883.1 rubredoxin [Geobacter sp. AOG1]
MKKWRCVICDYIHEGLEPPETCPECGASRDNFEEYQG